MTTTPKEPRLAPVVKTTPVRPPKKARRPSIDGVVKPAAPIKPIKATNKPYRPVALASLTRMLAVECAADQWWDQLNPRERAAYVRANPRSTYARARVAAPRDALYAHLRRCGFRRRADAWDHPVSRRSLRLNLDDGTQRIAVTHADGAVSQHRTGSVRAAKALISGMARGRGTRMWQSLRRGVGSLHAHLGVPRGQTIPLASLKRLAAGDHPLSARARVVLGLRNGKPDLGWS